MTTYIALLRAVNLGAHNKVAMADLRALADKLGLADARTLLQSGNLVFSAGGQTASKLEDLLAGAARKRLSLDTDFFVRSSKEWREIVDGNPFADEAKRDPGHLVLLCLKDAPGKDVVAALQAAITGRETVRVQGRHAYATYPDGIGVSKLTTALIERKLQTRVTGRNWNTVCKIGALAGA